MQLLATLASSAFASSTQRPSLLWCETKFLSTLLSDLSFAENVDCCVYLLLQEPLGSLSSSKACDSRIDFYVQFMYSNKTITCSNTLD